VEAEYTQAPSRLTRIRGNLAGLGGALGYVASF
jgi:hypothetical protein